MNVSYQLTIHHDISDLLDADIHHDISDLLDADIHHDISDLLDADIHHDISDLMLIYIMIYLTWCWYASWYIGLTWCWYTSWYIGLTWWWYASWYIWLTWRWYTSWYIWLDADIHHDISYLMLICIMIYLTYLMMIYIMIYQTYLMLIYIMIYLTWCWYTSWYILLDADMHHDIWLTWHWYTSWYILLDADIHHDISYLALICIMISDLLGADIHHDVSRYLDEGNDKSPSCHRTYMMQYETTDGSTAHTTQLLLISENQLYRIYLNILNYAHNINIVKGNQCFLRQLNNEFMEMGWVNNHIFEKKVLQYMVSKTMILLTRQLGRPRSPAAGSETNTTIFVILVYILDIDSHCPYLLSGETTFQLTSC